jgi:hypothetical protein
MIGSGCVSRYSSRFCASLSRSVCSTLACSLVGGWIGGEDWIGCARNSDEWGPTPASDAAAAAKRNDEVEWSLFAIRSSEALSGARVLVITALVVTARPGS